MKINKYINAFIATAIMAAGFASCTNDDTVDDKALYVINLKTTGLNEEQQAEFDKVLKSKTFGVDVVEAYQQVYGLYSSESYAKSRYEELLKSDMLLDSIVNVYADQSNNVDFSVNVVLTKGTTDVLKTSEAITPTVKRENFTISVAQNNGSLDASGIETLAAKTQEIVGVAPNSSSTMSCTPGYAKTKYLSKVPAALAEAITELVPVKGAPVIFEDFSESITMTKDGAEIGNITVAPYCDYVAWYEVEQGSLTEDEMSEISGNIKQDVFDGLESYPWDKRQKIDRSKALVNYTNLMITNNNSIQNIVNAFAAKVDKTDFAVKFHLSVADGVTAPVNHNWATFSEYDKEYKSNITKGDYKVVYEVAYGSLSDSNKAKVDEVLASITLPELNNIYEITAVNQFNEFLTSTTTYNEEEIKINTIAQYLAVKTKTLDFIITFKLIDSKNSVIEKVILKANDGWKVG